MERVKRPSGGMVAWQGREGLPAASRRDAARVGKGRRTAKRPTCRGTPFGHGRGVSGSIPSASAGAACVERGAIRFSVSRHPSREAARVPEAYPPVRCQVQRENGPAVARARADSATPRVGED